MTDNPSVPSAPGGDLDAREEVAVCWRNRDGSVGAGHALPRQNAEEMARTFSKMYPDETYWVEPRRLTPPGSYLGVRRKRPPQR